MTDGLVYPLFANEPDQFIIQTPPPIHHAVVGVDFGGTKSAHAFQLMGFTPGFRELVLLDELYHPNTEGSVWSPAQLEAAYVDFVRRARQRYRVYEARCDSAEQTMIQGLRVASFQARLGVEIQNAVKGPINDRIAFFNSMMAQGRFKICANCTATVKALREAVYDPKEKTKDVRLDDGTTNIDSLDAMEYTVEPMMHDILYIGGKK